MSARSKIRENKTHIAATLCRRPDLVLDKVHERALITDIEYTNLKDINGKTVYGHVVELVDKIMMKGENTCRVFLNLLQTDEAIKTTFPELVKINYRSLYSLPQPMQLLSHNSAKSIRGEKDEFYQVQSRPRGLCVIINNENFSDDTQRMGTKEDAESLAKVFSWLGFRVLMCKDQTMEQMERTLMFFTSPQLKIEFNIKEWIDCKFTDHQKNFQHGDAFICCILSHGERGSVMGIDMQSLAIKSITSMFKATEQSPISTNPKMFLIQACQGKQMQQGVPVKELQSDASVSYFIPEQADVLVALATVEDHVALRHITEGSWFVQSLCRQLRDGCSRGDDIMKILHRVNNEVSRKEGGEPGRVKQMPDIRSRLTKTLVLSPPDQ